MDRRALKSKVVELKKLGPLLVTSDVPSRTVKQPHLIFHYSANYQCSKLCLRIEVICCNGNIFDIKVTGELADNDTECNTGKAALRFADKDSRYHSHPKISNTLLLLGTEWKWL